MVHKTRIKAISWLLSLAMVLSLLPGMSLTAWATSPTVTVAPAKYGTLTATTPSEADDTVTLSAASGTLKGVAVMPNGEPTTNITSAGALVNLMNGGYTNYALNTSGTNTSVSRNGVWLEFTVARSNSSRSQSVNINDNTFDTSRASDGIYSLNGARTVTFTVLGNTIVKIELTGSGFADGIYLPTSGVGVTTTDTGYTFTMPDYDVVVFAGFAPYKITLDFSGNSVYYDYEYWKSYEMTAMAFNSAIVKEFESGLETCSDAYTFTGWYEKDSEGKFIGDAVDFTDFNTDAMTGDLAVYAKMDKVLMGVETAATEHGTIVTSKTEAYVGDEVTAEVTPATGYLLEEGSAIIVPHVSYSYNSYDQPFAPFAVYTVDEIQTKLLTTGNRYYFYNSELTHIGYSAYDYSARAAKLYSETDTNGKDVASLKDTATVWQFFKLNNNYAFVPYVEGTLKPGDLVTFAQIDALAKRLGLQNYLYFSNNKYYWEAETGSDAYFSDGQWTYEKNYYSSQAYTEDEISSKTWILEGNYYNSVLLLDAEAVALTYTKDGNRYTFTMPETAVTVLASFTHDNDYTYTAAADDDDDSSPSTTTTTTTKDDTSNPDASTTNGTVTVSTTKNADGSTTAKTTETATVAGENGSKTEVKAESTTTTKSNTDGSTTATTTATQTATTTAADGSKTVTETKTEAKETLDKSGNGTVEAKTTETVKDASGKVTATTVTESKGTVSTATDGTKTTTTTNTAITTAADGTKTTVVTTEKAVETTDGSTGKVVSDESGKVVSVEAKVSETAAESAAKSGEAVTLPVTVTAAQSAENATAVEITVPKDAESVKVEIPVEDVKPGTVAIIVHEDGTEEIVKTSTTSGNGVVLALESGASVKVVDNTRTFNDVSGSEWYADNVTWAASREVMNGVGRNTFAPNADTNRAMVTQILYNLDSGKADGALPTFTDVSANDWYADSVTWAVKNGVARGEGSSFGANDAVTREQLAVMLYNYADMKGYDVSTKGNMSRFTDSGRTSAWATDAMAWAVGVGILNGTKNADGSVSLNPQGNASRAQVTAMTERFCGKAAK